MLILIAKPDWRCPRCQCVQSVQCVQNVQIVNNCKISFKTFPQSHEKCIMFSLLILSFEMACSQPTVQSVLSVQLSTQGLLTTYRNRGYRSTIDRP